MCYDDVLVTFDLDFWPWVLSSLNLSFCCLKWMAAHRVGLNYDTSFNHIVLGILRCRYAKQLALGYSESVSPPKITGSKPESLYTFLCMADQQCAIFEFVCVSLNSPALLVYTIVDVLVLSWYPNSFWTVFLTGHEWFCCYCCCANISC